MPESWQNRSGGAGKGRIYHILSSQRRPQRKALCTFLLASPWTGNVYTSQKSEGSFFIVVAYVWSHSQVPAGSLICTTTRAVAFLVFLFVLSFCNDTETATELKCIRAGKGRASGNTLLASSHK